MRLYKSLCLSVSWSVGRSIRPSVLRSITPLLFWRFASSFCITAPAQPHVTVAVMYTASPTAPALQITAPAQHPRLMVSCIRPCFLYIHFNFKFSKIFGCFLFWKKCITEWELKSSPKNSYFFKKKVRTQLSSLATKYILTNLKKNSFKLGDII